MTTFKAMTWNIENLFRPSVAAPESDRQLYQRKLALLTNVITRLNPDLLGLQEVGSDDALRDLQDALGDRYPHRAVSTAPDARGIRVAALAQYRMEQKPDIVDFPPGPSLNVHNLTTSGETVPLTRMGRGALWVQVVKDGLTIHCITAHLKSKLLTFPGGRFSPKDENERAQVAGIALARRTAEAVTLRLHVNQLLEGNNRLPLIVMGDLNDVPEAQTSLLLNGPPGSEIGTRGFHRPDRGDDARLFNLAPLIPLEQRFSRVFRGRGELLDQILVSEEMLPVGPDGRRVLPVVESHVNFASSLPSITGNPSDRDEAIAPDHAPVIATFTLHTPTD